MLEGFDSYVGDRGRHLPVSHHDASNRAKDGKDGASIDSGSASSQGDPNKSGQMLDSSIKKKKAAEKKTQSQTCRITIGRARRWVREGRGKGRGHYCHYWPSATLSHRPSKMRVTDLN